MAVKLELLKNIHYFAGLGPAELESIKKYISEEDIKKGTALLFQGERSNFLYFIVSGVLKVYKTSAYGKEQILNIALLGESVNDVSTFDGASCPATMLAMTPVELYKIRSDDLKKVMRDYPKVAQNALKVMAGRVRRDSTLVEDLSFTRVTGRLAKLLLKHTTEETSTKLRLTQRDMAAIVGATRESVNKSIRIMEERGAIRVTRHGIVITNRQALSEFE
jgi:CRP/FNR family cyclic AMP-dependent transcriptional regulator